MDNYLLLVTTSQALVTRSDALVTNSFLFLIDVEDSGPEAALEDVNQRAAEIYRQTELNCQEMHFPPFQTQKKQNT